MRTSISYRTTQLLGWLLLALLFLAAEAPGSSLQDPYYAAAPDALLETDHERTPAPPGDPSDDALVQDEDINLRAFPFLPKKQTQPEPADLPALVGIPALQDTYTAPQMVSFWHHPHITLRTPRSSVLSLAATTALLSLLSTVVLRT